MDLENIKSKVCKEIQVIMDENLPLVMEQILNLELKRNKIMNTINEIEAHLFDEDLVQMKFNAVNLSIQKIIQKCFDKTSVVNQNKYENKRKCIYNDRGFCKYKENCSNFHSIQICDKFQKAGKCMTQGCKSRHPKDCYFWTKKESGCHRGSSCKYNHDKKKRFKNKLTETVDTKEKYPCDQCDKTYFDINVLKIHKEFKHENQNDSLENINAEMKENISCNKFQQKFTEMNELKVQQETERENNKITSKVTNDELNFGKGQKDFMNACEYKTTQKDDLKTHLKDIHQIEYYSCDHLILKAYKV